EEADEPLRVPCGTDGLAHGYSGLESQGNGLARETCTPYSPRDRPNWKRKSENEGDSSTGTTAGGGLRRGMDGRSNPAAGDGFGRSRVDIRGGNAHNNPDRSATSWSFPLGRAGLWPRGTAADGDRPGLSDSPAHDDDSCHRGRPPRRDPPRRPAPGG